MLHLLLQTPNTVVDTLNKGVVNNTPPTVVQPPNVTTLWTIFQEAWWVMIPLFIFLLIAVFFAIERLIVVGKANRVPSNFMNNIRDYLSNGKIDAAKELCRAQSTPVSRVIEKGISRLGKPSREISEALEMAGHLEVARAEKNLHYLRLVSRIAPMIGFVGTIVGVITIFNNISNSGDISIKNITQGLYIKMFSSAAGLLIGVIAFLFYHFLDTMVENLGKKIEKNNLQFLDIINEPGK